MCCLQQINDTLPLIGTFQTRNMFMDTNKIMRGILAGILFSIISLIIVGCIYGVLKRDPHLLESSLIIGATTIVGMLCGFLTASAE